MLNLTVENGASVWISHLYLAGRWVASIFRNNEGYWYLGDVGASGIWSSNNLRELADFIDELNENNNVATFFAEEQKRMEEDA